MNLKSGSFLFLIALLAIFIVFNPAGIRSSAGDFLANLVGLTERTFSPTEVYLGEIPLDNGSASSSDSKTAAGFMHETGTRSAKIVKTVPSAKTDKQISELNDKINDLQAKLNAASVAVQTSVAPAATSSNQTPSQSQSQTQDQNQTQPGSPQSPVPNSNPTGTGRILVSEIMAGVDGNADYEFIELYNAGSGPVDLTGWSVKKKSSTGKEDSLVAAKNFSGRIIQPSRHFLLGNDGGYGGSPAADVRWAHSNTLAYKNNSVVLYDGNGMKIEEIFWAEIPKDQSFSRSTWEESQFTLSSPSPKNSQSQ